MLYYMLSKPVYSFGVARALYSANMLSRTNFVNVISHKGFQGLYSAVLVLQKQNLLNAENLRQLSLGGRKAEFYYVVGQLAKLDQLSQDNLDGLYRLTMSEWQSDINHINDIIDDCGSVGVEPKDISFVINHPCISGLWQCFAQLSLYEQLTTESARALIDLDQAIDFTQLSSVISIVGEANLLTNTNVMKLLSQVKLQPAILNVRILSVGSEMSQVAFERMVLGEPIIAERRISSSEAVDKVEVPSNLSGAVKASGWCKKSPVATQLPVGMFVVASSATDMPAGSGQELRLDDQEHVTTPS